jgi:hypothetical protein
MHSIMSKFDILISSTSHFWCIRLNSWHLSNYLFTEVQLFGVHGTFNDLAKLTIPELRQKLSFYPNYRPRKIQHPLLISVQISLSENVFVNSSIQLKYTDIHNNVPLCNAFLVQFGS